VFVNWISECGS